MTENFRIENELNALGEQLGARPELTNRILAEIADVPAPTVSTARRFANRMTSWRPIAVSAAVVAAIVTAVVFISRPDTLYANAIQALQQAKTIHVTGWTRQVFRNWPLEKPIEGMDSEPKHSAEAWYWTADGKPRSYEKFGPVIQIRNAENLREYQEDANLLFIRKGGAKDYVEHISGIARHLQALQQDGASTEKLGERKDGNRKLSGVRVTQHGRVDEYWFDAKTNLPVRFTRSTKRNDKLVVMLELNVRINEPIPAKIASYEPPKTENIRYGYGTGNTNLAWRQHVQELGQRLQEQPPTDPVTFIPRTDGKIFPNQWSLDTPDGRYQIVPIDLDQHFKLTMYNFVRLKASFGGEFDKVSWRVPKELHEVEFERFDVAVKQGTSNREWIQATLNHCGYEFTDVVEKQPVWTARHDGRKLQPYKQVQPPVPYLVRNGKQQRGVVRTGIGYQLIPVTMKTLLRELPRLQNEDLNGSGPIVIDKTGLPTQPTWDKSKHKTYVEYKQAINYEKYLVATDSPWFVGKGSREMARKWYAKEFGVTFEEELRPRTIHVIRRKKAN